MFILSKNKTLIIKAIAIILVILGHWGIFEYGGSWGVSLFLIISGYGLTCSYYKNNLNNFFKKRLTTILIPYSLVTLLWTIIDFILGKKYNIITIITSILGINFKSPIDRTMWYISYLFLWYIFFYIAFKFNENKKNAVLTLFLCSLNMVILYKSGLWTEKTAAHIYAFSFPIGVLIGLISQNKFKTNFSKLIKIFIPINILLFFITINRITNSIIYMINVLAFSLTIVLLVYLLSFKRVKFIEYIGDISFYLYLFEGVFLNIKYGNLLNSIDNNFIKFSVYLLIVVASSITLKKITEYIKNKIIKDNSQIIKVN